MKLKTQRKAMLINMLHDAVTFTHLSSFTAVYIALYIFWNQLISLENISVVIFELVKMVKSVGVGGIWQVFL